MNDPYKSQRLALCKQQTMLHNANCVGCEKMIGLSYSLAERLNTCHKCDIGAEFRAIGKELLKCTRPRRKAPKVKMGKDYSLKLENDKKEIKRVKTIIENSKVSAFIMLRKSGRTIKEIADAWGVPNCSVKYFADKHGLTKKRIKEVM